MCIGDDLPDRDHRCLDACPVCFVLTAENALKLMDGDRIELGEADLFLEVANIGCQLCQRLCEIWSANAEDIFQPGATVSVRTQEDAPSGTLMALLFEISEPSSLSFIWEGTGWHKDKKFKSWAVPFGMYTKNSQRLSNAIILDPPNPVVNSQEVFDGFKEHLTTCLAEHEQCPKPDPNRLPTRVLRLDDDDHDRVFVHECGPGEGQQESNTKYVALSYCWGNKTEQVKLLQSNINEFSNTGVQISTLPRTIQDSITSTRNLGIKNLWIDSLCIIQDSKEDMDKEIANMAHIYKNATVTISAAAAADCGDGFLEDRPEVQKRLDASLCLPFLTSADDNLSAVIDWFYLCADAYIGHKVKLFSDEAINKRAWTFQESALAPRLLIFGSGPPQWRCQKIDRIAGLTIPPMFLPNPRPTTEIMKITVEDHTVMAEGTMRYIEREAPPVDDIPGADAWFPVLENYSHRELSYRTDKLTALSALAADHQSSENGSYAAGLWSSSLPRGLLWRRTQRSSSNKDSKEDDDDNSDAVEEEEEEEEESKQGQEPNHPLNLLDLLRVKIFDTSSSTELTEEELSSRYIAPTWSPMSSREPIVFEKAATQQENEYHTSSLVQINHIHVELPRITTTTTGNPFGQLRFSYLDITGPMRRMSWSQLTENFIILGTDGDDCDPPFEYMDFIVPDDPGYFDRLTDRYEPTFNPHALIGLTDMQNNPVDADDYALDLGDGYIRVRMPVEKEKASLVCADDDEDDAEDNSGGLSGTDRYSDVKQAIVTALQQQQQQQHPPIETTGTGTTGHDAPAPAPAETEDESEPPEFWLLEVERSMSPAGLVLQRVEVPQGDGGDDQRNVFYVRVGYFGQNRALDPEMVYLQDGIQVRGRKGGVEDFLQEREHARGDGEGDGAAGTAASIWNDLLRRKRICLV